MQVDSLEPRRLFAAAHLVSGSLHIAGQPFQANTITVGLSADQLHIDVNIQWTTHLGVTKTLSKSFLASSVKSAIILGGLKADAITVDQSHGLFSAKTMILGLSGDDVITAGDENDRIEAGAGNDTVNAGNGNNIIHGGAGNDTILTGSGINKINGNSGNDSITSGSGNDSILGGAGNDTIDAGGGNDKVFGGPGNDALAGGPGDDSLYGGAGDDSIDAGPGNDTLGGVVGTNTLLGGQGNDTFIIHSLGANPTNDYNPASDILRIVATEVPPLSAF